MGLITTYPSGIFYGLNHTSAVSQLIIQQGKLKAKSMPVYSLWLIEEIEIIGRRQQAVGKRRMAQGKARKGAWGRGQRTEPTAV